MRQFFLLVLLACSTQPNRIPFTPQHHLSLPAMGTIWSLDFLDNPDRSVQLSAVENLFQSLVHQYDACFSAWSENSELRRLEKNGLNRPQIPSSLFRKALIFSLEAFKESEGAFDITVGAVQWHARSTPVGMDKVKLGDDGSFYFTQDPKRLTFDGIVKGMTVGELSRELFEAGIKDFRVNAGGGNQSFAGTYLRENLEDLRQGLRPEKAQVDKNDIIAFLSSSSPLQQSKVHIFDPENIGRKISKHSRVLCLAKDPRTSDWLLEGALNDAESKGALIQRHFQPRPNCYFETE